MLMSLDSECYSEFMLFSDSCIYKDISNYEYI